VSPLWLQRAPSPSRANARFAQIELPIDSFLPGAGIGVFPTPQDWSYAQPLTQPVVLQGIPARGCAQPTGLQSGCSPPDVNSIAPHIQRAGPPVLALETRVLEAGCARHA